MLALVVPPVMRRLMPMGNFMVGRNASCLPDVAAGHSAPPLKREYLGRCSIPARMFNALRMSLQGKIASLLEGQKLRLDDLRWRIAACEKADCEGREARAIGSGTPQAPQAGDLWSTG